MGATGTTSAALEFGDAFYAKVVELMAADEITGDGQVMVVWGQPASFPSDIVSFGEVRVEQDPATMGSNRSREEILELDLVVSCQRGGGSDDTWVRGRAYQLLKAIELQVRVTDTTVGNTVRECFLVRHSGRGSDSPAVLAKGRAFDVDATFRAKFRVTS